MAKFIEISKVGKETNSQFKGLSQYELRKICNILSLAK